jgi:hypothetical protein
MVTQLPIDKDVPLAARRNTIYPFASMQVGDSIFVPGTGSPKQINSVCAAAFQFRNTPGKADWRFTARTLEGGVRIWRIA